MKKPLYPFLLFYIIIALVCLFALSSPVFAFTCSADAQCVVLVGYSTQIMSSAYERAPTTGWDNSCTVPGVLQNTTVLEPTYWTNQVTKYYNIGGTDWIAIGGTASRTSSPLYNTENIYPADQIIGKTCGDFVALCEDRMADAVTNCVSGELASYDCETDDYECVIHPCSYYQAECSAQYTLPEFECYEDAQGNGVSTCYDGDCLPELTAWAEANCHGIEFLESYSCHDDTGICKDYDCSDIWQNCLAGCGGQVEYFSCLKTDDVVDVSSPCTCKDGVEYNNPDAPVFEDPTAPDPLATGDENLANIADNQAKTAGNLAGIGNELGNIEDNTGTSAGLLAQIKDLLSRDTVSEGTDTGTFDPAYDEVVEEDILGKLTDFMSLNPFTSLLSSTSIDVTGANSEICQIIMGEQICMDFSTYEDWFSWAGTFLLSLVTIGTVLMVIRG